MSPEPEFRYSDLLPLGEDQTPYRLVTTEGVSTFEAGGRTFLQVTPEAIRQLTAEAMHDIAHYLRPAHLAQLRRIIDDPEASGNDRFVALDLLKNVNISAGGVLPMCQDTGTAIVMGKKSEGVLTGADDAEAISLGVYDAYTKLNLRYSQLAPVTMWEEKNTGTNLPAQIELYSTPEGDHGPEYKFLFMAKGGGSANKSFLYQETKAVLNPKRMLAFLDEKIRSLGTAACPPYHLAVVIGGTSAEYALKTAKYASAHYLDNLPTSGSLSAHGFRDLELEEEVFKLTQSFGIGAQFGGKYFCHDVRVVRLPRHGASCPVALAVSCSADRQALGQDHVVGCLPRAARDRPGAVHARRRRGRGHLGRVGGGHRPQPADVRHPRGALPAPRQDPALADRTARGRARHRARQDQGAARRGRGDAGLPARPRRLLRRPGQDADRDGVSGSFGPTTAGRMDSYVEQFQAAGGSMVMLAKGNRSKVVTAGVRGARGLLPRLDRRPRRAAGPGLHPVGRGARVPRARHGGRLEDRGRGLPRVHRRRRQGQRLLHRPCRRGHRPALRDPGALGRLALASAEPRLAPGTNRHSWPLVRVDAQPQEDAPCSARPTQPPW